MPTPDELVEVEVEVAWLDTRPVRRPTPPVIDLTSLSDGPSSPEQPRAYPPPRPRPAAEGNLVGNPVAENNSNNNRNNNPRRPFAPHRRSPPRLQRTDSSTLGTGQAGRASPRAGREGREGARDSPVDIDREELQLIRERNHVARLQRFRRRLAREAFGDDAGGDDDDDDENPRGGGGGGRGAVIDLTDDNANAHAGRHPYVDVIRRAREASEALARGAGHRRPPAGAGAAGAGANRADHDFPALGWLPGLVAVNDFHHHFHHHHHHANHNHNHNHNLNRNNRNNAGANNEANNGNDGNNNNNNRIAGAHLGARFFAHDIPQEVMAFHQILNGGAAMNLAGAGGAGLGAGAGVGVGNDAHQQHRLDVPPAREGFTRDTGEDVVVVCPACERILEYDPNEEKQEVAGSASGGGRRKSKKSQSEHHFWAVKACGHVFCRDCFEGRRPTAKNKSLFRLPDGSPAANGPTNSKVICAVEDCTTDVTSKSAWVGIFL